jgi:pyruvate, orthophosphate dikinase
MITNATQTFVHAVERIDATDSARFGGKATGLARMAAAGIPVPPAFVIGTDGYRAFRADGSLPKSIVEQAHQAMSRLESATGRRFGAQCRCWYQCVPARK